MLFFFVKSKFYFVVFFRLVACISFLAMPNHTAGDDVNDCSLLMISNLKGILIAGNWMLGIWACRCTSSSSCLTLVFNPLSSLTKTSIICVLCNCCCICDVCCWYGEVACTGC